MTVADRMAAAADSAPANLELSRSLVRPRFVGNRGDYWRLMIRGGILQTVTLGIYRFWLFTDARRFLWASTEVDGETPEYTGTAVELLLGFLMAIGILIPVYALLFAGSLQFGLISRLSGIVAFIVLAGFAQYAAFRARRYRLTRTVFRGLRFRQTGSPVLYAARAMLWWIPVAITLGLASPWASASLERYKMRNTFYGNLGGGFAATGARLFSRGILIWFLVVGPLVLGFAAAMSLLDWSAVTRALDNGDLRGIIEAMRGNGRPQPGFVLLGGAVYSVVVALFLYPAYQAILMRWWLGGLRLGTAAAASDLPMRRYYRAYLRYLLYVLLYTIVFSIVAGAILGLSYAAADGEIDFNRISLLHEVFALGSVIVAYVIYVLGCSTIYQVVVKMQLWRVAVESMLISNLVAFDHVQAGEAKSSAVGEGLADALGTGGI